LEENTIEYHKKHGAPENSTNENLFSLIIRDKENSATKIKYHMFSQNKKGRYLII